MATNNLNTGRNGVPFARMVAGTNNTNNLNTGRNGVPYVAPGGSAPVVVYDSSPWFLLLV